MWKVILFIFFTGCASVQIKPLTIPLEVTDACNSECINGFVSYRNKKTFFCECIGKRVVVIGRKGTVFR